MPRPRKRRMIGRMPEHVYFKPQAVPLSTLEENTLTFDELETIRYSDIEGMSQLQAAEKMEVHQSTFHRTLASARKKIADALINGKAIKVNGGDYKMPGLDTTGPRGSGRGLGRGAGTGTNRGAGIGGNCKCPKCGYVIPHQRGVPCNQKKCPECGNLMIRE